MKRLTFHCIASSLYRFIASGASFVHFTNFSSFATFNYVHLLQYLHHLLLLRHLTTFSSFSTMILTTVTFKACVKNTPNITISNVVFHGWFYHVQNYQYECLHCIVFNKRRSKTSLRESLINGKRAGDGDPCLIIEVILILIYWLSMERKCCLSL